MKRLRPELPHPGEQFLRSIARRQGKKVVSREWRQRLGHLYNWLDTVNLTPQEVQPEDLARFEEYLRGLDLHYGTRLRTVQRARIYYHWLKQKGHFHSSVTELIPRKPSRFVWKVKLPPDAHQYLALIATQKRKATCASHATNLRRLYCFLATEPIDALLHFDRPEWERFLKYLGTCATFAEVTRKHAIFNIRAYLFWLYEQGKVSQDPFQYCRSSDSPKVPYRLPRPLEPALDRKLQHYLTASEGNHHSAFLLMRWSGIRIGELHDLAYDCLRTDLHGHIQLKVPLGKLGTERLVPLDSKAVALAKALQEKSLHIYIQNGGVGIPTHLLLERSAKRPTKTNLVFAFVDISQAVSPGVRIYSHQLRHTYATTLLNAGINLTALRDLLGHHTIAMTLRYAAVTQDKLREDYLKAILQMEGRYHTPAIQKRPLDQPDFPRLLLDLVQILKKIELPESKRRVHHLVERIQALRRDLQPLLE